MKRVLVTGGNKGIGFAIAERILETKADSYVLLGSRNKDRGLKAVSQILEHHPGWKDRIEALVIDVSNEDSVLQAAQTIREKFGAESGPLYGIVNNAGIAQSDDGLRSILEVNTYGIKRVCEAFIPFLSADGGRIVNMTSASGPNFVFKCSDERQKFITNPAVTWDDIVSYMGECLELETSGDFESAGLGDGSSYGISKACANAYTIALAREHPKLCINACTPGFIETDMTRVMAASRGSTPAEMGMKTPKDGTVSALFLLFGEPEGSGHYYGSDGLRSPLDRYRAPGTPAFSG